MKRVLIVAMLIVLSVATSEKLSAQNLALGLRAGLPTGVSLKFNPMASRSAELIVGSYGRGNFNVTGLYEFQKPINNVKGLSFFAGPGVHFNYFRDIGHYRYYYWNGDGRVNYVRYNESYVTAGVDVIVGLDYSFDDFPLMVGIDIKPAFDIGRYDAVFFMDAALNLRFKL